MDRGVEQGAMQETSIISYIAFKKLVLLTDHLLMVYDETMKKSIYLDYCVILDVFSLVR